LATLEACTAAGFGQRRKTLRSSLKSWTKEPEPLLESAGLSSAARAEELTPADFVRLAAAFEKAQ
jgi:16S rRNA (adenine1518-N6/adenine1519-N6)-dimethyltransferase